MGGRRRPPARRDRRLAPPRRRARGGVHLHRRPAPGGGRDRGPPPRRGAAGHAPLRRRRGPGPRPRRRLGIDRWIARATPAGKVAELDALRAAGRRVLMIGDGLNDAAALGRRRRLDLPRLRHRRQPQRRRPHPPRRPHRPRRRRPRPRPRRPPPHPGELRPLLRLQHPRRADRARRPGHPALRRRRHVGELDRRGAQRHPPRPAGPPRARACGRAPNPI